MAKRDKRYHLPQNRIVIPLIIYTLVFILVTTVISLAGDLFATYATKLKVLDEVARTSKIAKLYNDASEEELDVVFNDVSNSGYEVFVTDKKLNVLRKNGKITAVLEKDEEKEHKNFFMLLPTSDISSDDFGIISNSYTYELKDDFFFFADKNSPYIDVEDKIGRAHV